VASIGVPIFLGGDEGFRLSLPHTRFLLHQPSQGVLGQASDIEIEAKEILRIRERINHLLAEATKQPLERIEKDSDRNFWMSAEQAFDYGLVNRIVGSDNEL
jgi:ATP-dependent Clp protease protease subunit